MFIQGYSLKCIERYCIIVLSKSLPATRKSFAKEEIKIQLRLVRQLDGTFPFHS